MFKVAKRHKLSVLEEYGFKLLNKKDNWYRYTEINTNYYISKLSRRVDVVVTDSRNACLSLFYKLIKDGIIEEE